MTWRDEPAEPQRPEWVKAWAAARYRHHDMRLWPEQELGYRDTDNDWNQALEQHGIMPPKDRERYADEARTDPAGIPAVDDDELPF